ncbi:MAG: DUF1934 domain-containing protein [Clostridia bacterium]|nr:DUF1934 domain-containing protein [Clostridia bacterium]
MSKVLINITGQQSDGENVEDISITTEGDMKFTDSGYQIKYTESDEENNDTTTLLSVFTKDGNDCVSLDRSGMINSNMVIEKGARNTAIYNFGPLSMTVGVFGEHLLSNLCENGGSIEMCYTVDINSVSAGRNHLEIDVTNIN